MEDMTMEELRDYIRNMPDDEILRVTIDYTEDREEAGNNGQDSE